MSASLVLVTRPLPEAEETAQKLRRLGYETLIEPMLEIALRKGPSLDLSGVQALMVTSRNGARALARRTSRHDLPVYAVGEATASLLRASGFFVVESARGAADDLTALVRRRCDAAGGRLVHIRGDRIAGDPAGILERAGYSVEPVVLYETRAPSAFSRRLERTMRQRALGFAVFFSPRTARTFVTLARAAGLGLDCEAIVACALSAAVATALSQVRWRAVRVSVRPEQDALLDLLARSDGAGEARGEHGQ